MVLDESMAISYEFLNRTSITFPPKMRVLKDLWNNLMIFLTPWLKWHRVLLGAFINRNDGWPITWNRKSAWLSVPKSNRCYCLETGLFGAKLFHLHPTSWPANDGTPYSKDLAASKRLCITKKQCQAFLDEVVAKTKDCIYWW